MTNDEIDRYIHVEIMGNETWNPCRCYMGMECGCAIYTDDGSPRSLLQEVVAKVLPLQRFENRDSVALLKGFGHTTPLLLTAGQISRACVEAHKSRWREKL